MKRRTTKRNKRNARSRQPSSLERSGYFSSEYLRFIKSPQWKAKREQIFRRYGRVCANCRSTRNLQCDHLRYPLKGSPFQAFVNQSLNDFQVLCASCHKVKTQQSRSNRYKPTTKPTPKPVRSHHPIYPIVPTPQWWQRIPWEVWLCVAIVLLWLILA